MSRRSYSIRILGLFLLLLNVEGCAVFRATGHSMKAVGEGVGHAVAGTGRAVARAASETKRDLTGR